MKIKNLAIVATAVALLATLVTAPSFAVDKDKYVWPPAGNNTSEMLNGPIIGYTFGIVDDFTQGVGAMEAGSFISVAGALQPLCTGFSDPICIGEIDAGRGNWWSNIAFAQCKDKDEVAVCVEGVRIANNDGTFRELTRKKVLTGNTWPADPTIGLPEGSAPSLWVDPQSTNQSKGYLLSATGALNTSTGGSKVSKVNITSFQASITPYEVINEAGVRGASVGSVNGVRKMQYGAPPYCVWADTGECGVQSEFEPNARLQLVLHIPTSLSGWLQGRMSSPEISVERLPGSGVDEKDISRVAVAADSVEVPLFSVQVNTDKASQSLKDYFADRNNKLCNPEFDGCKHGYIGGNTASSYDAAFEGYNVFKEYFSKNASVIFPRWSVRSLTGSASNFEQCRLSSYGKFQGVVTTNASVYQGGPPTFDGESFDYKVAGLHNKPNGETFQGSYDLVLESKFARCLYKFTSAPIRASVSITNADGNTNIESSVFNEKDGWIKLSINGFTFSSPKINVKLMQDKVAEPTPTATIKPVPIQKTITCVKGKVTKKVKAVAPKCPAGYKKK